MSLFEDRILFERNKELLLKNCSTEIKQEFEQYLNKYLDKLHLLGLNYPSAELLAKILIEVEDNNDNV